MEGFQIKHGDSNANNTTAFPSAASSSTFDEIMTGGIGYLPTAAIDKDGTGSLSDDTALFDAIYGGTFGLNRRNSLLGDLPQSAAAVRCG